MTEVIVPHFERTQVLTNGTTQNHDTQNNPIASVQAPILASFFPRLANPRGKIETLTREQLIAQLSTCDIRPGKDGELISGAIYPVENVYRNKENVQAVSMLQVDCDESFTLSELSERIERSGAFAILYSTHSHGTPDHENHPNAHAPGERYRVLFPLPEPIPVDRYPEAWERLNLFFAGEIDAACKDASRAFYTPSHPTGDGFVFQVFNPDGPCLTLDQLPELPASYHEPPEYSAPIGNSGVGRPGDDYNAQATNEDTAHLLEAQGWTVTRSSASRWKARRPGKRDPGISATIGHHAPGVLHVFSSNAAPFEANHAYKPYSVYGLLKHGGNFKSAAKELASAGYGKKKTHISKILAASKPIREIPVEDIPLPALTDDKGNPEYDPTQLVQLVQPEWKVQSLTSDAAHAQRIREHLGEDLCYSPNLGWLVYDRFWQRDDKNATKTCARVATLSQAIRDEAATLFGLAGKLAQAGREIDTKAMSKAATQILKHAQKKAESKTFIESALHLAAGLLTVETEQFDQKPWIIGFQNGTWDKGEWREHRRKDYLLYHSPVHLDFDCDRTEWKATLDRITAGDLDLQQMTQDVIGYIFSAASHLRKLPFFYGPKGTGKSTITELAQTVLGDMAATIDPKKLQDSAARERLGADLWNRRLAACSEAGSQRLEAELLKTLSGGDRLAVRFLFREAFTAPPRHVLLMVTNDPPRMDAYDAALKDRVIALPFVHPLDNGTPLRFTGGKRIEAVRQDHESALVRGFAAWAMEGLARVWRSQDIHIAKCAETATAQFWADTDQLTPFWETIEESELFDGVGKTELRKRYEGWCETEGARAIAARQWTRACKDGKGLKEERRTGGKFFWYLPKVTKVTKQPLFLEGTRENGISSRGQFENAPCFVTNVTIPTEVEL